jgi:uncharacterized membrane protein
MATTHLPASPTRREMLIAIAASALFALLLTGLARRLMNGAPLLPDRNFWLALHLTTVIPALPLGAYLLVRRKGDSLHKALGRIWVVLMLVTVASSFGLHYLSRGLSPIHALSVLVLVSLPIAVRNAMRGRIAAHRRTMTIVYLSLVVAGGFTFLPGRLMGAWLLG